MTDLEQIRKAIVSLVEHEGLSPSTPYWIEKIEGPIITVWVKAGDGPAVSYVIDTFDEPPDWFGGIGPAPQGRGYWRPEAPTPAPVTLATTYTFTGPDRCVVPVTFENGGEAHMWGFLATPGQFPPVPGERRITCRAWPLEDGIRVVPDDGPVTLALDERFHLEPGPDGAVVMVIWRGGP